MLFIIIIIVIIINSNSSVVIIIIIIINFFNDPDVDVQFQFASVAVAVFSAYDKTNILPSVPYSWFWHADDSTFVVFMIWIFNVLYTNEWTPELKFETLWMLWGFVLQT